MQQHPSSPGFQPSVWGPLVWPALHMIALNYPDQQPSARAQQSMSQFLHALGNVLPCLRCQQHYRDYMTRAPPPLAQGRSALFGWVFELQQQLAVLNGNTKSALTPSQAIAFYQPLQNGFSKKSAIVHIIQQEDSHAPSEHSAPVSSVIPRHM